MRGSSNPRSTVRTGSTKYRGLHHGDLLVFPPRPRIGGTARQIGIHRAVVFLAGTLFWLDRQAKKTTHTHTNLLQVPKLDAYPEGQIVSCPIPFKPTSTKGNLKKESEQALASCPKSRRGVNRIRNPILGSNLEIYQSGPGLLDHVGG